MSDDQADIALLAAIGNPEQRYLQTRHNAGHWLADRLVAEMDQQWRPCSIAKGKLADVELGGRRVRVFKSGLAMNISGRALAPVANFYRIDPGQILVLHDELAFPPGVVRMKYSGGSAGHNGIKSIVDSIGDTGFWRCRIGIGHPGRASAVTSYVLSKPTEEEGQRIDAACAHALGHLARFAGAGRELALTAIHSYPDHTGTALAAK